jgi:beta-galactosidase
MGALGPFIPVGDCPPDRDYWVKLWSGEFLKFDGATGKRLSERRLQRWANSGARDFQTVNGGDLVAFATFGGTLQICWLHDMDAIFDSRVIGPKTGPMSLNGDGSAVAMVTDDKLLLIETGRWRRNAQLRRNASEILGLDLGAVRRPSAYVAPQGDERTTVVAMDRADPRTRCLVQSGLAATWSSDELAALRDGEGRLVIVDATPEVLARLANEIGTVRRFAERGGWLVLWGVTPEGLSAFNRLVGVEHLLRKYEPCLVTLGAEMHVAVVGLDNDDVGMNDGRRFSSPNPRQRRPAGDAFSWLVDLDDIAPFCKWPDPAYWRKEPGSARLWRFGWPMSMVDGMSGDYGRRTDFLIDLDRDEPTAWEIVLPRREVIEGFSIACNFGGLPLKSVALTFEPGSVRREFRLADTYLRQDFVIPDGGVPADRVQIQLLGVEKAEGRQNQLFVGNIWIRVRRDESFTTRVKPLLNVGGLVAYPMAKGGILLNQYRIVEREQNPLNALRKRVLMRKILTNLGARFDAENAASPGP